jgi:hypothetical protein
MNLGNLGGGGFYGGGGYGPGGPYGAWPGCGCSTVIIVLAMFLMLFGGCLRTIGF